MEAVLRSCLHNDCARRIMAMVATRRLCGYPPSSTQSDLDGGKGDHNVQSSGGDYDVDIDGGEEEHKGTVVPGFATDSNMDGGEEGGTVTLIAGETGAHDVCTTSKLRTSSADDESPNRAVIALDRALQESLDAQGHLDGPFSVCFVDAVECLVWTKEAVTRLLAGSPQVCVNLLRSVVAAVDGSDVDMPVTCRLAAVAFYRTLARVAAVAVVNDDVGTASLPRVVATVLNDSIVRPGSSPRSPQHCLFLLLLKCLKNPTAKMELSLTELGRLLEEQAPLSDDDEVDDAEYEAPLSALAEVELSAHHASALGFDPLQRTDAAFVALYKEVDVALSYVTPLRAAFQQVEVGCSICRNCAPDEAVAVVVLWALRSDAFAGQWRTLDELAAKCQGSPRLRLAMWDRLVSRFYLARCARGFENATRRHATALGTWLRQRDGAATRHLPLQYRCMLASFVTNHFNPLSHMFVVEEDSLVEGLRLVGGTSMMAFANPLWCSLRVC